MPCSGFGILYRRIPSLPFALVWVCLLRVLSFRFGYFWTPSLFVPRLLWPLVRSPLPIFLGVSCVRLLSGVLRRTYPSFFFMCEDILSAFEILSLVLPFLSLSGVEVWFVLFLSLLGRGLGPSVFGPSFCGLWTLLLALGSFVLLSSFVAVRFCASFLSSSTLYVWLGQNFGVSFFRIRALVVRRLSFSWDLVLVLRHLVASVSEPVVSVSLWALGGRLCSVFLSSACGLMFFRPS